MVCSLRSSESVWLLRGVYLRQQDDKLVRQRQYQLSDTATDLEARSPFPTGYRDPLNHWSVADAIETRDVTTRRAGDRMPFARMGSRLGECRPGGTTWRIGFHRVPRFGLVR